jgi:hypothetical protein
MNPHDRWYLGGLGVAIVGVFATLAAFDDLDHRVPVFLALSAAVFVLYAAAVRLVLRRGARAARSGLVIVAIAVAARLVLLPAAPDMSADIYRYLWEGRVVSHGHNPFAHAPDAPELESLRDANSLRVQHSHMATIYPPAAQAVFALAARIRPALWVQKLLFVLFDVATVLVLIPLLRLRGIDPLRSVIYAWNPLVIFETAHSGHVDAVGVFAMVLGLWLVLRARPAWGSVALALSFLTKFVTVMLAPFYLVRRAYWPWLLLAVALVVIAYLPFAGAGMKLFTSLRVYALEWRFNGLAYEMLTGVWHDALPARRLFAAAVVLFAFFHAVRQRDVLRYAFLVVGFALLLAPTLYPWYVLWIVPFLCVFPNRAWILFTGLVFVSYWVWVVYHRTGEWALPPAVYAIEYAPFLALLALDAWSARRRAAAA